MSPSRFLPDEPALTRGRSQGFVITYADIDPAAGWPTAPPHGTAQLTLLRQEWVALTDVRADPNRADLNRANLNRANLNLTRFPAGQRRRTSDTRRRGCLL